jgi:hypothetical protein
MPESKLQSPYLYAASNERLGAPPNPILDSGAPKSVGGTHSAAPLASSLGVALTFRPPTTISSVGWGVNSADAKPVVCIWVAPLTDLLGQCYELTFHLISGNTPLLIGEDVLSNADILNTSKPSIIRIRAKDLREPAQFFTYSQSGRRYLEAARSPETLYLLKTCRTLRSTRFCLLLDSLLQHSHQKHLRSAYIATAMHPTTTCAL